MGYRPASTATDFVAHSSNYLEGTNPMKNRTSSVTIALLALLSGGLIASGCGGGSGPEDAVDETFSAVQDGDFEKVCENLSSDSRDQIESFAEDGQGCTDFFDGADADQGDYEIKSSEENGDEATVKYTEDGTDGEQEVNLVKEDGDWKLVVDG